MTSTGEWLILLRTGDNHPPTTEERDRIWKSSHYRDSSFLRRLRCEWYSFYEPSLTYKRNPLVKKIAELFRNKMSIDQETIAAMVASLE